MNTSPRDRPTSSSSWSSSWPARPTKGSPGRSSCWPGRLADEHQVGVGVPVAENDWCGPRGAGSGCSRTLLVERESSSRRSAAGRDCMGAEPRVQAAAAAHAVSLSCWPLPDHPEWTGRGNGPRFNSEEPATRPQRVAVIGAGRLGTRAQRRSAGRGPDGRGPARPRQAPPPGDAVVLCVPDGEIARGGNGRRRARHPSWGTRAGPRRWRRSTPRAGRRRAFGLHPLQTFAEPAAGERRCRVHGSGLRRRRIQRRRRSSSPPRSRAGWG